MSWYVVADFPYGDFLMHVNIISLLAGNHQLIVRKEEWKDEDGNYPIEYDVIYPKENFYFRKHIPSFRNILFNGEIEEYNFDWYRVIGFENLNRLVRENTFYNFIIMNHTGQYLYHLNYFENNKMCLAINSYRGDLPESLYDILHPKYLIEHYRPDMKL